MVVVLSRTVIELSEILRICYDCFTSGENILEVLSRENNIQVKQLETMNDLCTESVYTANVSIVSISPKIKFIPISYVMKCNSCNATFDFPIIDVGELIKIACQQCGSKNVTLIDRKVLPYKEAKVVIEVDYEGAKVSSLCEAKIVGNAVAKVHGGLQEVLVYPHIVQKKKKKNEEIDLTIVLYILDTLMNNDDAKWSMVVKKLAECGAAKVYVDDLSIYDTSKHLVIPSLDPDKYLRVLASSFAPEVYGDENEKILLLLALVGGYGEYVASNRRRFVVHELLIGDPSTAKSALVKAALECAPRGLKLTADLATKVSLVAAEDRSGVINPGPLALMDGDSVSHGIVVIEQVETWRPELIMTLRDILEEGEAHRSVRAVHYSYRTRCALLATANWENGFYEPRWGFLGNLPRVLKSQVDLSRFDAIIVMLTPGKEQFVKIVEHKLSGDFRPILTHKDIRVLIQKCRLVQPNVDHDVRKYAKDLAEQLYDKYLEIGLRPLIRTIDAIMRLATAFAKLLFSPVVRKWHVEYVYNLIMSQFEKVQLNIPGIPSYLIEVDPSKRALKEAIWRIIVHECREQSCDKTTILIKFRNYIEKLIEVGKLTQHELERITGGSLTEFFEKTVNELAERGYVYFPTRDHVRAITYVAES